MLPEWMGRGGCRWEVGNVLWHNSCGRPFGILLLKWHCASPSEVSSLPLAVSTEMDTHTYTKITQGRKELHVPVVLLSWRLVRAQVWIAAIVIKSNFLRPGI